MTFPKFKKANLIQHRLDRKGKLPSYVFLVCGFSPDEAFIINGEFDRGRSSDSKLVQLKIEKDGTTKRATIKDLSLKEVAQNTFNYYSSSIGSEIIESSNKEIFIDLTKKIFPNVKKYFMV